MHYLFKDGTRSIRSQLDKTSLNISYWWNHLKRTYKKGKTNELILNNKYGCLLMLKNLLFLALNRKHFVLEIFILFILTLEVL